MNTMGPMCEPWGTPKCTNTSLEVEWSFDDVNLGGK